MLETTRDLQHPLWASSGFSAQTSVHILLAILAVKRSRKCLPCHWKFRLKLKHIQSCRSSGVCLLEPQRLPLGAALGGFQRAGKGNFSVVHKDFHLAAHVVIVKMSLNCSSCQCVFAILRYTMYPKCEACWDQRGTTNKSVYFQLFCLYFSQFGGQRFVVCAACVLCSMNKESPCNKNDTSWIKTVKFFPSCHFSRPVFPCVGCVLFSAAQRNTWHFWITDKTKLGALLLPRI